MNANAVELEREHARPVMNGVHAAWSIGAICGALGGSAAAFLGWTPLRQAAVLAVPGVAVAYLFGARLLRTAIARRPPRGMSRRRARATGSWNRRVVLLGLIGAGCEFSESGLGTWSGVYLNERSGASLAVAPLALLTLTVAVALGRTVGDRLQARHGRVRLIRGGAAVAALGLTLVLIGRPIPLALVGFAVLGAGLSIGVPILLSAAGHAATHSTGDDGLAASRVANYSTLSFAGILSGPPVIGWIAQRIGFAGAFASLFAVLGGLALGAGLAGATDRPRAMPEPELAGRGPAG
jgi:MFS family permease